MRENWKWIYLPFIGLILVLIVIAVISYYHGRSYWSGLYGQFLATISGVIISVIFAFLVWRYQQHVLRTQRIKQLYKDLQLEINENMKRLDSIKDEFTKAGAENHDMVSRSMLMREYNIDNITIRFLRLAAVARFLQPDNRVLIRNPEFEDIVELLFFRCNQYNEDLSKALRKYDQDTKSEKSSKDAFPALQSVALDGIDFMLGCSNDLIKRLDKITKGNRQHI